jgi:acyl-CoA synthetase (NDP forming)
MQDKLTPLFHARSVAVIGASNDTGKWGYIVLKHLLNGGFQGQVYPVNPSEAQILGLKVYRDIPSLPEPPDLAVIIVPPTAATGVVRACVEKGIKAGVIITAGFAELGEKGAQMQQEIAETARQGNMVFVGPNCNGIMSPWEKLHIQFPSFHVPPGPVGILSQSGNVMDVLARHVMLQGMGCSLCIASGNEASLNAGDYLEHMGNDPHTQVILCYIEGLRQGRRFFRIAGEVSKRKPVIMVKVGKTQAGARAAASHTAAIAGADDVFNAMCRQSGIIRASSLDEMLNTGLSVLNQPLPRGRRVGIVTAGGGWGVLAADACAGMGFDVVRLPENVLEELDKLLPAWWNRGNPVDLVAGSTPDNIFKAVEHVLGCPEVDAGIMLSIMPALRIKGFSAPEGKEERAKWGDQAINAVVEAMEHFNALARKHDKPLVVAATHIFSDAAEESRINYALGQKGLICHSMPQQAAIALDALARCSEYRRRAG